MLAAAELLTPGRALATGPAQPEPPPGVRQPPEVRFVPGEIVVFPHDPFNTPALVERMKSDGFLILGTAPMSGMILAATAPVPGIEEILCEYLKGWEEVKAAERNIAGEVLARQPTCTPGSYTRNVCELPYPSTQIADCTSVPSGHPDDKAFCRQWGLHNSGQSIEDRSGWAGFGYCWTQTGVPGVDINLLEAWAIETGSEQVTVAVLDTGIEDCNPDFDPDRFLGPGIALTCEGNDGPLYPCLAFDPPYGPATDNFGHGTAVASIIGAVADNDLGIAGIDQHCKLLSVRCFSAVDNPPNMARGIIALEMILTEEEYESVRVVNISWKFPYIPPDPDPSEQMTAFEYAITAMAWDNRFVVVGAGNAGEFETADELVPQRFGAVFTVGGIDSRGWRFEHPMHGSGTPPNFMVSSSPGECVDFMAPGMAEPLLICQREGCDTHPSPGCPYQMYPCAWSGGEVNLMAGTSFAAPKVAAAISLILARAIELGIIVPANGWSALTFSDMYEILQAGCRDRVSWENPLVAGDDDDAVGHDRFYGWGLIDIAASPEYLEDNFCCP